MNEMLLNMTIKQKNLKNVDIWEIKMKLENILNYVD